MGVCSSRNGLNVFSTIWSSVKVDFATIRRLLSIVMYYKMLGAFVVRQCVAFHSI